MVAAANPFGGGRDIILSGYSPATPATLSYHFQGATPLTIAAVANSGDTGWTLTVAGALLRSAGCMKVYPMALATTAGGG